MNAYLPHIHRSLTITLGVAALLLGVSLAAADEMFDPSDLPSQAETPRQYLIGINLAGAEFAPRSLPGEEGRHYGWPTAEGLDYYQQRGFELIRLPFSWERLQPQLGGELDQNYAAALVRTVKMIGERDMLVLLDLHNYARYHGKTIKDGGFTYEQFHDVWDRIAKLMVPYQEHIWGYGLMNEPHITNPQKLPFWQGAIDAVRKYDATTRITVSGEALKSDPNPRQFHLKDPAKAIVYETHFYFDHDNSGRYANSYEHEASRKNARVNPMVGVQRLKRFVQICEKYNVQCMVGEFGAPAGAGVDKRWLEALDNALAFMHEHRITSTYWSGGEYWSRKGNTYVVGPNGWRPGESQGKERPQMKLLRKYIDLKNESN